MLKRKKPVALLEVLIALSLIFLCVAPLIRQPIANHQAEMAQAERIETARMAAYTFSEIRETFLKKQIRWKQIPELEGMSDQFFLPNASFQLPPFPPRPIERSFTLKTEKEKYVADGTIFKLVAVHIKIGKNTFTYYLTLFKKGLAPNPEAPASPL